MIFLDAIEHVEDVERVLSEISRIMRSGGRLLMSAANRNSVNQIVTRKLGYPEFVTNHQHFREFSFEEVRALLTKLGFAISSTAGVFLYPYWGIAGIDAVVRDIEDNDPEFVEVMRALGERAGAEYAYTSIVVAERAKVALRSPAPPSRTCSSSSGIAPTVRRIEYPTGGIRLVRQARRMTELAELGGRALEEQADCPVGHQARAPRHAGHQCEVVGARGEPGRETAG